MDERLDQISFLERKK